MALHQVGLEPEPRLSAPRTAYDHNILIPCRLRVFGAIGHHQAFRLRENDVVLELRIGVGGNIFCRAP